MKYILMLTLLFLIYFLGAGAEAFQNEPDGFHGIKWEAPFKNYSKEMIFKYADEKDARIKFYNRKNEKKRFKGIEVIEIVYGFYNGRFLSAGIEFKSKYKKEARKTFVSMFGKSRDDSLTRFMLGPDDYLQSGKISSVALICTKNYDCYIAIKSKYVKRSAWVYRYMKGASQLTKSDKQRIDALELAARKYREVVGTCGIEFLDSRGQVILKYRMPNKRGNLILPFSWKLNQIIDGWVIYYNDDLNALPSRMQFLVAVKQSSLRGELRRGSRLFLLGRCLGKLNPVWDTTTEDLYGFPVRVKHYEAIYP